MKDLKLQLIKRGAPSVYACEGITELKKFLFSYIPERTLQGSASYISAI